MKKTLTVIIVILVIAVLGVIILRDNKNGDLDQPVNFQLNNTLEESDSGAYVEPESEAGSETNKPVDTGQPIIPGGTIQKSETPSGYISQDDEISIRVDEPQPGDTLTSPFVVSGQAAAPQGIVRIQITNLAEEVLIDEIAKVHAPAPGEFGPYKITLSYEFQRTKEGFIQVFIESAVDSSPEGLVKIPVKFE